MSYRHTGDNHSALFEQTSIGIPSWQQKMSNCLTVEAKKV